MLTRPFSAACRNSAKSFLSRFTKELAVAPLSRTEPRLLSLCLAQMPWRLRRRLPRRTLFSTVKMMGRSSHLYSAVVKDIAAIISSASRAFAGVLSAISSYRPAASSFSFLDMSNKELRNVFEGPDSMERYFDLEAHPSLPLVEIPSALNPYRAKGVRIYAKMMTMHPAHNVKVVPAMEMLRHGVTRGKTRTIVEYSSGSTVLSMAMIGRVYYGIDDVCAYVSNKTSKAKLRLLQLFGLNVTLFGGPSQPGPYDRRGGIQSARECAADTSNAFNPNQYENDRNWKAHARATGPQLLKQLPHINVICAGMGTAGTMTGLGDYFEKQKPSVFRLGICTKPGQRVPGPRTRSLLTPVQFPWQAAAHEIEEVGAHDAFEGSMELCRWGLVCGPSSGFNLRGLLQFLRKRDEQDDLGSLRGFDDQIRCVFMCCDLPYQYIDEYFHTLGPESFPPIANEVGPDSLLSSLNLSLTISSI